MRVWSATRAALSWPGIWTIVVALVTFGVFMVLWFPHSTGYNNYALLADSFVHGHVWVDPPGAYIDALAYGGRKYIIEGPLPGVLLMPLAVFFGKDANQTLLSFLLSSVAGGAAWELARRVGVPWISRAILTLFMLLGTDLFFCGLFGDVWFLAHVASACFTLLALVELMGRKRAWLVMIWAVCAFESRFSMILAIPIYAYLLVLDADRDTIRRRAISTGTVLLVALGLWVSYNFARWGVWYDIGYTAWYHQDSAGSPTGSPFQLQYLPMQLQAFFVYPPERIAQWPYLVPSKYATALTYTSPALILAFFAWRPGRLVLALWVATLLTAAPNFVYYVVGFVQFGMRHALDFEPFLFALMCLSARNGLRWWGMILCLYSALTGVWGTWIWATYLRANG